LNTDSSNRAGKDGGEAQGRALRPQEAIDFCRTFEALQIGGFWSTDKRGRITYLSDSLAELLAPGEEVIGRKLLDLLRSEQTGESLKFPLPMALVRRTQFERIVVQTGSGREHRWWSVSGQPQEDASGGFAGFLGHCVDITAERDSLEENEQLAQMDALTGLLNRRKIADLIDRQMVGCEYGNRACALMLLDLDRFKLINDKLGHAVGDAILRQVADRLTLVVGEKGKVGRFGGDEFNIVLPDCEDRGELGELAGAIIAGISQPYVVDGHRCSIGVSIGIAIAPFDGHTREELVRNADLALYAAKHNGRNRFRYFSSELLRSAEERRRLEEDLQNAVARGELELNYQPIVDARRNIVTGAETLIRWNHPQRGYVPPAVFIPIAEESSLIARIGAWVMRKACEDAAQWPENLRVSVNVSPVQFADTSLPGIVAGALSSSGLDPSRLELEITEKVFVRLGDSTDVMFKALKGLGVRLALDNFGTGYSSLNYLKGAPFDKIKIDRSFVTGAEEKGSRNRAIIAALVALANALDMETTAEGIETQHQLAMIRKLKVSHAQGYIYSRSMTNEELVGRMRSRWVIKPAAKPSPREDSSTMYRTIGAVHGDHYYSVVLRNLSKTGALIEGLADVPVGAQFVLDFGEGQLAVASLTSNPGTLGQYAEFEIPLVSDGNGGLFTCHRVSPYHIALAGLPGFTGEYVPPDLCASKIGKVKLPDYSSKQDWLRIANRDQAA